MTVVEVARVGDISPGKSKHVEAKGIEIFLANVNGKFYAMEDRCGHMSASLAMGTLQGTIVTCPMHFAQFDVTTGKRVKGPTLGGAPGMEQLPQGFQQYLQNLGRLMGPVKTYDRKSFPVVMEEDRIKVKI